MSVVIDIYICIQRQRQREREREGEPWLAPLEGLLGAWRGVAPSRRRGLLEQLRLGDRSPKLAVLGSVNLGPLGVF